MTENELTALIEEKCSLELYLHSTRMVNVYNMPIDNQINLNMKIIKAEKRLNEISHFIDAYIKGEK